MTVLTAEQRFTPDDVLRMESEGLYELVDGKLREKEMSELANETAVCVSSALYQHARTHNSGRVLSEQTYRCFPDSSEQIRRPDVSFINSDRLPEERYPGHVPIAPDIAVEVVSPNDLQYDLDEKLEDYRSAGIKLVWVVNPVLRTVMVYRADGTVARLFDHETLTGGDILPEFAVKIADLLPPRAGGNQVTVSA